ncbi:MAG: helix-turn-helix transcriptional regulator [Gemmatimonadales bacterium]
MTPVILQLKELRESRGLTQAALAKKIGVRRETIADLERGATRKETLDLIERLCRALDVEPGELIVREPGRRKK